MFAATNAMRGNFVAPSLDLCSCVLETTAFPDYHTGPAIDLKLQELTHFKVDTWKS